MTERDDTTAELGIADVRAARARIAEHILRTPVLTCPALDALAGARLFLKAENLQRIGAFKARGAMHALVRMDPERRARGVITYSSGNHAQAVALAAQTFGVRADIAMPIDAPAIKADAVRALGARVHLAGTTSAHRRERALAIAAETGGAVVEPFDDLDVVLGQATATLELVDELAARGEVLDALLVPVGGGGLLAGACLACSDNSTVIYAVEPQGCDAMGRSLAAGRRVVVEPAPTLADGLRPVQVGVVDFAIARGRVAGAFTVDDAELGRALVRLLVDAKLLVEPSGAAALAAALRGGLPARPRNVGVLLSGGNVEPTLVARLLAEHAR